MTNTLESYLVKLGFAVDAPSFRGFETALKKSEGFVSSAIGNIGFDLLKWQGIVLGAFTGVAGGFALMANRVANADQDYRLFGLRMMMTKDNAKSLKIALDALGEPIEAIAWDPELGQRFRQLQQDQRGMQAGLGGGFDGTMRKIRDMSFEVTRFKVELDYFEQQFVVAVFGKMGYSVDQVLDKMRDWNQYVQENMPQIAGKFADVLIPILKQTWGMLGNVKDAAAAGGTALINLIGGLSGDKSIESTTFKFENLAKAVGHITDGLSSTFSQLTQIEGALASGSWDAFSKKMREISHESKTDPDNPLAEFTLWGNEKAQSIRDWFASGMPAPDGIRKWVDSHTVKSLVFDAAIARKVDPYLASSIAAQESSFRQFDKSGNVLLGDVIPGRKDRAHGVMQLMGDTAAQYGVNRDDTKENIQGGVQLLADLLKRYSNNPDNAIAAYYMGAGNVDHYLKKGIPFPEGVQDYVRQVEDRSLKMGDTIINFYGPVTDPHAAAREISAAMKAQMSRMAAQMAPSH